MIEGEKWSVFAESRPTCFESHEIHPMEDDKQSSSRVLKAKRDM